MLLSNRAVVFGRFVCLFDCDREESTPNDLSPKTIGITLVKAGKIYQSFRSCLPWSQGVHQILARKFFKGRNCTCNYLQADFNFWCVSAVFLSDFWVLACLSNKCRILLNSRGRDQLFDRVFHSTSLSISFEIFP